MTTVNESKVKTVIRLQAKADAISRRHVEGRGAKCLQASDVVAIVDTREQTPLDLSPLRTVPGSLDTGDYSLLGWIAAGLSVSLVADHQRAGQHAARLLFTVARRRHREFTQFMESQAEVTA